MLVEAWTDVLPQRIEHDIQTLTSRELCSRYEIGVACNQDQSLNEPLVSERCNVDSKFDVNAVLRGVVNDVAICKVVDGDLALQQAERESDTYRFS